LSDDSIKVDVMGLRCPIPVQRARKAIRGNPQGTTISLCGDDPESLHDIPTLLKRLGLNPPVITEIDGGWEFVIIT
tara:strand:+ start:412 stop:639 length:228 start_codon:yes stop_codon:yes gene_type:complete